MYINIFWIYLLFFSCKVGQGQDFSFLEIKKLSQKVKENSGLVIYDNKVYTHNDSGDGPNVYSFPLENPENVTKTKLKKADNTDWEDIAFDGRNLYVFDTGANKSKRKKMAYYTVPIKNVVGNEIFPGEFEKTVFKFKNEYDKTKKINCEAVTYIDDKLIFLSKSKSKKAELYQANPGEEEAQYITEVKIPFEVTGATTYNEQIFFCGYRKIGDNIYFSRIGSLKKSPKEGWGNPVLTVYEGQLKGQCEGIFIENEILYLSTEQNLLSPPKLYVMELNKLK